MACLSSGEIGFDIEVARDRCLARLAGLCPRAKATFDDGVAAHEDSWSYALAVCWQHKQLHGAVRPDACRATPCRAEGLCLVVEELWNFHWENSSEIGLAARRLKENERTLAAVQKQLQKSAPAASRQIDVTIGVVRASRAAVVERYVWSNPLRQKAMESGRGAQNRALLHAVWRHLRVMGFTYREIAALVPDHVPGNQEAMMERIRKAQGTADLRTFAGWSEAARAEAT